MTPCERLCDWLECPDPDKDHDVEAALKVLREAPHSDDWDYSWILQHARWRFEEKIRTFDALDAKGDKLIALATASLGALYGVLHATNTPIDGPLFCAYLFFLLSLLLSIRLRAPLGTSDPLPVDRLVEDLAGPHTESRRARDRALAFDYSRAYVGVSTKWKRRQLGRASHALLFGYGAVGLSLIRELFTGSAG